MTSELGINRLSTYQGGGTAAFANSGYGYGSAVLFNAALQYTTNHMFQSGMCTYLGAQYNTNQTRPGMFYYDANGNYFAFYIGENALTSGDTINSWAQKMRIDNAGILSLSGGSGGGAVGAAIAMLNVGTPPALNPTGGGIIYIQSGSLKYRGSSGTVTTVAPA